MTMMKAVIGARVAAERKPTMQRTMRTLDSTTPISVPENSALMFCPSPAPIASDGAKMPPGRPER